MTKGPQEFRGFVAAVKQASDLVAVVSADVDLRNAGTVLKGLSPFRGERTASFVVWPDTQTWRDWSGGGGRGGDVFTYVMERDRVSFREAVETLAERAGLVRPHTGEDYSAAMARRQERRDLFRLMTLAAADLHAALPIDVRDRWYRGHYGFTDETVDHFKLGWGDGSQFQRLRSSGHGEEDLLRTGLFVVTKTGVVDFFHCRLVFPYWKAGQVRYFAARKTELTPDAPWEEAKYKKLLTRSDRHPYVSDAVLNATFFNEDAAREKGTVVVTEGITDCISAVQAGLAAFSPCTTRFRDRDVAKLLELTARADRVVVCNDSEVSGAGHQGALATAAALDAAGRPVRIATLPRAAGVDKVDVNGFLKAHPPAVLRELLGKAPRYIDELLEAIPADCPKLDLEPRLRDALVAIARKAPLEQEAWIDAITARFRLGRRVVRSLLQRVSGDLASTDDQAREQFKGEVLEADDHYYVLVGEERVALSTFRLVPTERVRLPQGEVLVADVHTKRRVIRGLRFSPDAWHSKRQFLESLTSLDMQWTGTDDNVQGLLRLLCERESQFVRARQHSATSRRMPGRDGCRRT